MADCMGRRRFRLNAIASSNRVWNHDGDYESFIRAAILKHHITAIVTYNDTGERNRTAIKLATSMGLSRYIVEHGYLRPHWITFDRDGVNGHSTLPKR